jgi:repressor LexA
MISSSIENPGDPLFSLAKRTNVPYTNLMSITERKKQILEYMAAYQAKEGFPPTIREICAALGLISPGSLLKHIQALEKVGLITKMPGKKRAWKLSRPSLSLAPAIPVIGQIAAGTPILAQENREDELPVDPKLFGSQEAFALRIRGDSMIEAHIQDGDLAIVRPQNDAENGEIVAVQVQDMETEATLKILRKKNTDIELHPANSSHKPLVFSGEERSKVKILGKLIGVIRSRP